MDDKILYDSIWKRRSVRKYREKRIEKEKIDALKDSVSKLNDISGLTMEFVEESDCLHPLMTMMFRNVRSVISVKGRTNDPDLNEKCGYYGERIILEATALGLGTCWVAGIKKKNRSLNVKDDETVVCAITVGYGAEEIPGSSSVPDAPHRKTKSISEFLDGKTDVPEWVASAMKAVQFAPTAMNSQKTRFRYTDGVLAAEIPDGRLNMVDLGITKLHFELAAGGKFALGSPGIFTKQ